MLIDWFTVGAQIVNFLVLIWLLKRYLYKPVLDAIATREKRIADEVSEAAASKVDAEHERDDFQKKNKAFDDERSALLAKVNDDVGLERERLLKGAREQAEALRAQQVLALDGEQLHFGHELIALARDEVFQITRKALSDLAGASLEEQMLDVFLARLAALDASALKTLRDALADGTAPVVLRTTFALASKAQERIQGALDQAIGGRVVIQFEVAPELSSGIELLATGQKLSWTIDSYLALLQAKVAALAKADVAAPDEAVPPTSTPQVPNAAMLATTA